jgi:hypothetical protein
VIPAMSRLLGVWWSLTIFWLLTDRLNSKYEKIKILQGNQRIKRSESTHLNWWKTMHECAVPTHRKGCSRLRYSLLDPLEFIGSWKSDLISKNKTYTNLNNPWKFKMMVWKKEQQLPHSVH